MQPAAYPNRSLVLHGVLFVLVFLSFVLPVLAGTPALLPVWLSGGLCIILSILAIVDASRGFFAPKQQLQRSLRGLSGIGAIAQIIGWALWLYIFGNVESAGTVPYRVGTFFLSMATVLSLFVTIISAMDVRRS